MGVPTGILQAKNAGKLKPLAQGARKAAGAVERPRGAFTQGKHVLGKRHTVSAFGIDHGGG